jgi:prophage DNA circulation protein
MTWRERQQWGDRDYRRASFRGFEFWVEDYSYDGGRRLSVQRFPGDQYTNVQDLGRDSAAITVTAFLLGDDYDHQRAALEGALLEGGEGELYLPWRGPINVTIVGRVRVDETLGARGICRINFECLETSPAPRRFTRDTALRVQSLASTSRQKTKESFADRFKKVALFPTERKYTIRRGMADAANKIVKVQERISSFIAEIPKAANTVTRLTGAFNDLINTPLDLCDEVVNAVVTAYSGLRSIGATAQNVIDTWGQGGPIRILKDQTFSTVDSYDTPAVDTSTSYGQDEQTALDAWYRMVRLNLLYELADLVTRLAFESRDQAISLRSEYIEAADPVVAELEGLEYENVYSLNTAVCAYLEEASMNLPSSATFTPATSLPALVIAHLVYADATRSEEIVIRNSIIHPLFVPEGEPLEILRA